MADSKLKRVCRWILPDTVRATITYLIVIAAIGAFLFAVFAYDDHQKADMVAGFFSGLLGVVLGYFFGSRGVDAAEQVVDQVKDEVERTTNETLAQIKKAKQGLMDGQAIAEALLEEALAESDANVQKRLEAIADKYL